MGRPKIELNPDQVEKLGSIAATVAEMATVFDVSLATMERRLQEPEFAEARVRGLNRAKVTLRRLQFQLALAGDKTMLIWLGKNLLAQRERWDLSSPEGEPVRVEHSDAVSPLEEKDIPDVISVLREANLLVTPAGDDAPPRRGNGSDPGAPLH